MKTMGIIERQGAYIFGCFVIVLFFQFVRLADAELPDGTSGPFIRLDECQKTESGQMVCASPSPSPPSCPYCPCPPGYSELVPAGSSGACGAIPGSSACECFCYRSFAPFFIYRNCGQFPQPQPSPSPPTCQTCPFGSAGGPCHPTSCKCINPQNLKFKACS
jgi:hypothetical protein